MKYVLKVRTDRGGESITCDSLLEAMDALLEREGVAIEHGGDVAPLLDDGDPLFVEGFKAYFPDGWWLEAWVGVAPEEDDPIDWVATLNALRDRGTFIQDVVRKAVLPPDGDEDHYPVLVWTVRDQCGSDELAVYPDGKLVIETYRGSPDYYDLWVAPRGQSRMIYRGTIEGHRVLPTWVAIRPHVELVVG